MQAYQIIWVLRSSRPRSVAVRRHVILSSVRSMEFSLDGQVFHFSLPNRERSIVVRRHACLSNDLVLRCTRPKSQIDA